MPQPIAKPEAVPQHTGPLMKPARAFMAELAVGIAVVAGAGCEGNAAPPASPPARSLPAARANDLRAPGDFASIADRAERSRAIFREATRVMLHPRCVNCHPAGDVPAQGDLGRFHDPPVVRGPENEGVPGLYCTSCHQDRNATIARVPGAPKWRLAPREMAWVGKTPHTLCEQLKDPARNGHRSLAQVVDHTAHDDLVGWGWAPGADRAPVPGTQAKFAALVDAWVKDGAECPPEETP
jgi:hypothetical protein